MTNIDTMRSAGGPGRGYRAARCPRCALRVELCLCSSFVVRGNRTAVELHSHYREWNRPSNTARLLLSLLSHASVQLIGVPGRPSAERPQPKGANLVLPKTNLTETGCWVLFPGDSAETPERQLELTGRPSRLIVPDGSWPQAKRQVRRLEPCSVPRVALRGGVRLDRLRRAPKAGYLSTFEAVVACLVVVEGAFDAAPLLELFGEWQRRSLQGRFGGLARSPGEMRTDLG